jgi:hypothetical protein
MLPLGTCRRCATILPPIAAGEKRPIAARQWMVEPSAGLARAHVSVAPYSCLEVVGACKDSPRRLGVAADERGAYRVTCCGRRAFGASQAHPSCRHITLKPHKDPMDARACSSSLSVYLTGGPEFKSRRSDHLFLFLFHAAQCASCARVNYWLKDATRL